MDVPKIMKQEGDDENIFGEAGSNARANTNEIPWDEWEYMSRKERKKALKMGRTEPLPLSLDQGGSELKEQKPVVPEPEEINPQGIEMEDPSHCELGSGQEVEPFASNEHDEAVYAPANPELFSDFLSTPIVTVKVGQNPKGIYYLHEGLLIRGSDRFRHDLDGRFKEATERTINLPDEKAYLFGHFVKYLYCAGKPSEALPEPQNGDSKDYVLLAELYALGERLVAKGFQHAALRNFCAHLPGPSYQFNRPNPLPNSHICSLLQIACEDITERLDDDPLRKQIFWAAATRLAQLNEFPRFQEMLVQLDGLALQMAIRGGNSVASQPQVPKGVVDARFKAEAGELVDTSTTTGAEDDGSPELKECRGLFGKMKGKSSHRA